MSSSSLDAMTSHNVSGKLADVLDTIRLSFSSVCLSIAHRFSCFLRRCVESFVRTGRYVTFIHLHVADGGSSCMVVTAFTCVCFVHFGGLVLCPCGFQCWFIV